MASSGFDEVTGKRSVDDILSEGQDNHSEVHPASEESMLKRMRIDELQSVAAGDNDSVMGEANEDSLETQPLNIVRGQSPEEAASPVFEHRPLSPTTADGMSALRIEDVLIPTIMALPSSAGASVGQEIIAASASQESKETGVDGTTTKRSRKPQSNPSGSDQAKPPSTPVVAQPGSRKGPGMSRDQQKYCSSIVKVLKKHRDAFPFLKPVDIVAFNIPHYPDVVKNPMDLGTVEQKLDNYQYGSPEEFAADVRLIFNNCYAFNGQDSDVSKMAENVEATFERQLQKMPIVKEASVPKETVPKPPPPPPPLPATAPTPTPAPAPAPTPAPTPSPALPAPAPAPAVVTPVKSVVSQKAETTAPSTLPKKSGGKVAKKTPTPPPPVRRFSEDGRPKREIHPPLKDLPDFPSTKRNPRSTDPQLKYGSQVIRELKKSQHRDINWPFVQPVDPVSLNIPDYPTIIKNPMDISTIERKLRDGEYANGDEFEADWRLMFKNCYTYNPDGTSVNLLGKRLEAMFDSKWAERPPPPQPNLEEEEEEEESSDGEGDDRDKTIANLQRTLMMMQQQLHTMSQPATKKKKEKKDKPKAHGTQKAAKIGGGKTAPKPKPVSKRKRPGKGKGEEEYPEFTFEQKKELSERINTMAGEQLSEVVRIIQSSMPLDGRGEEEIELDIDALDRRTLHRLHTFVVGKPIPRKRPPTKKAKTHYSEEEHNRKIMQLEHKLELFNQKTGPVSSQDINMNEEDGSSSDSDSGSSSSDSDSDDSGSSTD